MRVTEETGEATGVSVVETNALVVGEVVAAFLVGETVVLVVGEIVTGFPGGNGG